MSSLVNEAVSEAIKEIGVDFPGTAIVTEPDGSGGARVIIESVDLGTPYRQKKTWLGAHLPAQLPYADIYPVFADGALERDDGQTFGAGITPNHRFMARNAIQISRRSKRADLSVQTPAMKLLKIVYWLRSQ